MLRAVKPNKTRARRVLVVEHLVINLTSLTCYLVCASKKVWLKKGTDMKIQNMVWNNTKGSLTCSQPTSSKCMVPAAPHTAVQFALCSEPLNPTRQKARRVLVMEHLVINLTSLTCYLVCASKKVCYKKEKDKHKNTTHCVEQYQELFHMLPAN